MKAGNEWIYIARITMVLDYVPVNKDIQPRFPEKDPGGKWVAPHWRVLHGISLI